MKDNCLKLNVILDSRIIYNSIILVNNGKIILGITNLK